MAAVLQTTLPNAFSWMKSFFYLYTNLIVVYSSGFNLLTTTKLAMVHVVAWHSTGDKPLPKPMMTKFCDIIWLSLDNNESTLAACTRKNLFHPQPTQYISQHRHIVLLCYILFAILWTILVYPCNLFIHFFRVASLALGQSWLPQCQWSNP